MRRWVVHKSERERGDGAKRWGGRRRQLVTFLTAAACAADSVSCCCSPLPGRAERSFGCVPPSFPAVSVRQASQLNNHIFLGPLHCFENATARSRPSNPLSVSYSKVFFKYVGLLLKQRHHEKIAGWRKDWCAVSSLVGAFWPTLPPPPLASALTVSAEDSCSQKTQPARLN